MTRQRRIWRACRFIVRHYGLDALLFVLDIKRKAKREKANKK